MGKIKLSELAMTPTECLLCPAREIGLFSELKDMDRRRLLERLRHVRGPAGALLFSAGDSGHDIFIVRSGLIKLLKYARGGSIRIVRLARPGDVVGLGLIIRDCHGHTAQAMTAFDACRVPVDLVSHEIHRIPGLEIKLFHQWQTAVEAADTFLTELSTGTANARVARLLLYLLETTDGEVCQAVNREEMGELLGITMETASRVVAEFKRAGIVSESDDLFHCDLARLEEQAMQ
jgi:CRP/FNR family transcriptional regulator